MKPKPAKWECKYHGVFVLQVSQKKLDGGLMWHSEEVLRALAT
ncbi:hypothetical protein SAMN05443247_11608 [Bradyrhizobium erythrophlei]|jgi:hypothetical protein|nr:hypothetical protein SAMN05443247_04447 [Bradyrhizobium erythrophlei]SIO66991.1 hypothetical protein SAMN05443247_11608 [Bradyrhizobium erythrophlei]